MDGCFTDELPAAVTTAIAEALPSTDPLDRADFDPIDYINAQFPSEQAALEALTPFMAKVSGEIGKPGRQSPFVQENGDGWVMVRALGITVTLDDDISKAIEEQSRAGEQATKDIAEAQAAIRELFEKIKDITNKAEQSELMVQEICR
jgi:vacuolar protein sorting-associated protein 53